jgi:N6-L-threonylcarbamoyladenine synthase
MNVLGIETSCDETSVSVVRNGKSILANSVISSLNFHKRHGGIIPEIASRMQLETILPVAQSALKQAGTKLSDIDLISVTSGPGLLGSLLVGISFAKSLALVLNRPLVGVNHLHSHIYANFLDNKGVKFPFVALVVSGGHTSLFYVKDFDDMDTLGQTQDDACGEAFDKVAKILGIGYPGGPVIERAAKKGNPDSIKFGCSGTKNPLDFSFSGIKTAVLYYAKKHLAPGVDGRARGISDVSASFQKAVVDALVRKSLLACSLKKTGRLVVGGGVAANNYLRDRLLQAAKLNGVRCYFPAKALCMDNAAMVAGLGFRLYKKGTRDNLGLSAWMS